MLPRFRLSLPDAETFGAAVSWPDKSIERDGIAMKGRVTHPESIDATTSRSICDAVGERLQQSLSPKLQGPAPELERLLDELRRRERQSGSGNDRPGNRSGPPGRRFGFFF
jgi:hypothetical protein